MIGLYEIDTVLYDRDIWGRSYANRELESKRRSAILWMKYKSKRGWWRDSINETRKHRHAIRG